MRIMNKKIVYLLSVYYKYSMLDMTFSFRIRGHITYRNKKYYIDALKTHDGPVFHFTYFQTANDNMKELLVNISDELLSIIDDDLHKDGPVQNKKYEGEIEIKIQ